MSHLGLVGADMSLQLTRELIDGVRLSLITERGSAPAGLSFTPGIERDATALRASFDFAQAGLDLTIGEVREDQGVLGLVWSNTFGATPGGEARFGGIGFDVDLTPAWRVSASAEFGVADMGGAGWLQVIEPLRTSAYTLQAQLNPDWMPGALTFSLIQPLRVEDGLMAFMAPTATKDGRQSLAYETRAFSPSPSGRELRLGVGYSYWRGSAFSAFGEAMLVHEPGHVAERDADAMLRLGVRIAH